MNLLSSGLAALVLCQAAAHAAGSPGVEQDTQAFLDALESGGGTPLEQLSPEEARAVLAGAQESVKVELPDCTVHEKTISTSGGDLVLYIVRPAGARGSLPAFMFFHGGGWVLGDFPTHERLVRDLAVASGAVAIFVDYARSPEAHYPEALNQAYAATKWVAANGPEIKVDGTRLAVAGNSVGGNMAAAVALMAKDQGSPKIAFQLLLWPVTDADFDTPSYNGYAEGHFLTRDMMIWFWDNYTTDPEQRQEIYASPLRATIEQLAGLPPALIQVAEFDVLRDEGLAYGRKLDEAGVAVAVVEYQGMIHDFGLLNPLAQTAGTRSAMLQAGAELRAHLRASAAGPAPESRPKPERRAPSGESAAQN